MQRTTSPWLAAMLCLALTQLASAQDPAGKLLPFDPVKHGFNFVNSWDGEILVDVPLLGRFDLGNTSYGLCGGMSMAAMDSFLMDAEVPDFAGAPASPPSGSQMRSYIYNRQQDTFKVDNGFMIRRLIAWIPKPIKTNALTTGLHVLTDRQFKRIVVKQIDQGQPVNLCLVRNDANDFVPNSLDKLTPNGFQKNHQVLAIGYRLCPKTAGLKAHWAVDIYDPNYPDRIMSLHYSDHGRAETPRLDRNGKLIDDPKTYTDPKGQREYPSFRAFFAMPYSHKTPPWARPTAARTVAIKSLEFPNDPDPTSAAEGQDETDPVLEAADRRDTPGAGPASGDQVVAQLAAFERRLEAIEARLTAMAAEPGRLPTATGAASPPASTTPYADAPKDPRVGEGEFGLSKEQLEAMRRDPRFVGGIHMHPAIDRVLNAALKGRTGRLVLTYPKDTKVADEWTLFAAGEVDKYLTYGSGAFATELVPGRYAVLVNKVRIEGVQVTSRNDTRVPMGALRLNVGDETVWTVRTPGSTDYLTYGRGPRDIGLAPGDYEIEINKQREKVTVKAGEVTEY